MQDNLERGAGILLPISSLPSKYGIGTLGEASYSFIRKLKRAGQKYWQVLPVGPTSYGDSPYQSFSTFAGNPYFIDLDILIEEKLLVQEEVDSVAWYTTSEYVEYETLWNNRYNLLELAYKRANLKDSREYEAFVRKEKNWLDNYALFMACKNYFGNVEWLKWDEDIKMRTEEGIAKYTLLLQDKIGFWKFIQFKFYEQWNKLKKYAKERNIQIIGDIPIYVALDSADVWTNPKLFQLDENLQPINVAGCPPDAFSDDGQKWGNPLYNWDVMEMDGFQWWRSRIAAASRLYDVIRIDHFIGIVNYYVIPADKAGKYGWFEKGPGIKLLNALSTCLGNAKIIAEDLGAATEGVQELLEETGYPGMKVLEFAFDGNNENPYLPHMVPRNCVFYGGTHDNETLKGFFETQSEVNRKYAMEYCDAASEDELVWKSIKTAYQSGADVVIFQMQDILQKDNSARMNLPSTMGMNWKWRLQEDEFTINEQECLKRWAQVYGRTTYRIGEEKIMLQEILENRFGKEIKDCTNEEIYQGLLQMVKNRAKKAETNKGKKKLYYISAEFLIGKLLSNNLINLGIYDEVRDLLEENGKSLAQIEEVEVEPSLGNGGLGRLAACFLDSIASLGLNGDGIGLNYHLGLFKQVFQENKQKETANPWIDNVTWLDKKDKSYVVKFKDFSIKSVLYDIAVTGYENRTNQLHLFDIESIDESIVEDGISFDKEQIQKNLTLFLYPDDSDDKGRLLRVYQQYFMVSNGAQMILDECIAKGCKLTDLDEYAVIQINDTHPTMVIPELIRLLMEKGIAIDKAIEVVSKTCAYTNHTILAEALETWPMSYIEQVAPAIVPIIIELDKRNKKFLQEKKLSEQEIESLAIIDSENRVHMAHLDIHYGFSVNGVAYLHTEILKNSELNNFYKLYPDKFNNKTNGITFRRWLLHCNKQLSSYLESMIGDDFKKNGEQLKEFEKFINDEKVLEELLAIKKESKLALRDYILKNSGVEINPDSIFDVQVKRLHEYKRQQLNALYGIHKYLEIKRGNKPATPITMIFGAKAAPAYTIAKDIIHLILCLQQLTENDPEVSPYLKIVMLENYNVTYAEKVIPACDISEQISLASKEASGTGNMKFMLNGAVTLGTMDGANVEISQFVGPDNIYIFGEDSETVIKRYEEGTYSSIEFYEDDETLKEAVNFIISKEMLKIGCRENLNRLFKEFINKDWFMTFPDFSDYVKTKEQALKDYENRMEWAKKMLVNISNAGFFSSDRTIKEYNKDIWKLEN
ncbi:4-alpha-glucanotransferase [[Clostridium] polysaccharolyticum]|uniref:Alpha-1,4 glucan phosphorylase n=1 Tax=[Clostridium] polysaccharolyticum TaxID=29364 RepID=A0A1I0FY48_9FIRM|nr:4-alpha-glucanotransferase [[Clostridium] polysaccharolyticum]SET62527.1 starch phosphorylase [[Clostridium] polysaccharolyticum]